MAQKIAPRIRELPQDGRFWRVDWLGSLLPNPNISTEPAFQVVPSPFKKYPMDANGRDLAAIGATDRNQQQTVYLGIGQLPYSSYRIGSSTWYFLVLGLEEYSASMPYSELTVIRNNDGNPANESTDTPNSDKQDYSRPKPEVNEDESLDLQNQHDTNAGIQPAELTLPTSRFKAIRGRKPNKPTKEQSRFRNVGGRAMTSMVVDKLATGQGGYGEDEQTTQRLNIVPEHQEPKKTTLPASFETFVEAVELLNQAEGFTAEIRTADSLEFMPLIKPPGRWQWSYLDSSRLLRRKVIVADISFDGRYFNLIEFEQRNSEHFTL